MKLVILLLLTISTTLCATKEEWKSRTIYQVFTDRFNNDDLQNFRCLDIMNYCGGNHKGIESKLDYIQGMGFDAIWISPINKNVDGGYHGYWISDFYDVNEHFGTKQDLKDLINECHKRGIWVMADVIVNHVGPIGFDYSKINPFNREEHYHDFCQIKQHDWDSDQWKVENCRFEMLPDLNTENPWVKDELIKATNWLIDEFKFDGMRIDTVKHIHADFWREWNSKVPVFTMGEVPTNKGWYCGEYQKNGSMDSLLNYPMYYSMLNFFIRGMSGNVIENSWKDVNHHFEDTSVLALFIDNHDQKRFLNHWGHWDRLKSALAFNFFAKGIPILYYGTEQGYSGDDDPHNREQLWPNFNVQHPLYRYIKKIIELRKKFRIWEEDQIERYVQHNVYAFSRGKVLVAVTNTHSRVEYHFGSTPYDDGEVVCNIFHPSDCVRVRNHHLHVVLNDGEPKIYVPQKEL